jgi:predicted ATPase
VAHALEELYAPDPAAISAWLAAHYDAAGMPGQAMRCHAAAASVARQRFADAEAADLLRRALRLCREFPEGVQRDSQEMELLVALGPVLVTTHGYSMPEVGETYERGLLLSRRSGDQKHLFSLLSGAWVFRIVSGRLEESRRLAQLCVDGMREQGVAALEKAGRFLLGTSLFHLGELAASREQMEQALPSGRGLPHPALALFAGPDIGVFCRVYLSQLLLLQQLGSPEEAVAASDEAIALARELAHPFSLAIALDYGAMLNVFRQQGRLALARVTEASEVCRRHGFAYYLAFAEILAGWATAVEGDSAAGVMRLRQGIDALKATGAELRLPFYYGLLAEACARAGQRGEALANIATGFAFLSKNGEAWAAAELHRIHGDVLRQNGDVSLAEASYQRAMEAARQTGAGLFEQRATARLSRRNTAER